MNMDALNVGKILLILGILQFGLADFPNKTYSCRSGEYIESNKFCDKIQDCSDQSDEPENCTPNKEFYCPTTKLCVGVNNSSDIPDETLCLIPEDLVANSENETKFLCNDRRCLDTRAKFYCNCFNFSNSKESNNESKRATILESKNCILQNEKFLCNDSKRCLSLEHVCDGFCNCFDCSDEYGACNTVDKESLKNCPDFYFPTPKGAQCIQNLINGSAANNFSKINDLKDCTSDHFCDQKCTLYKQRAICSCAENYTKESKSGHGFGCESEDTESSDVILIYSTQTMMKLWNFSSYQSVDIKPVEGVVFTAAGDNLYYTNYLSDTIFSHSISSNKTDIISVNGTILESPITSIVVDYITNNLYFTTNTTLSVCSTSKVCMDLINGTSVSHVALAPRYRRMFYVKQFEHDKYFIMKSNMDGSEQALLMNVSYSQPTPLTVDESIKRIYWLDQNNATILSKSIFDRDNEIRTFRYTGKVVSIAALDSKLYFTKELDNKIHTLENNENFVKYVDKNFTAASNMFNLYSDGLINSHASIDRPIVENNNSVVVQYLYAYNPIDQNKLAENPCQNLSPPCTGLCLLRPNSTNSDYQCLCDGNATLVKNRCWQGNSTPDAPTAIFIPNHNGSTADTSKENQHSTGITEKESTENNSETNLLSTENPNNGSTADDSTENPHSTGSTENNSETNLLSTENPNNESTADDSTENPNSTESNEKESTANNSETNQHSTENPNNESTADEPGTSSKPSTKTRPVESFQEPTKTITTSKSTKDDDDEGSSIGWIVISVIILLAFVVCGVHFYKRRAGYSHFSFQDLTWRRSERYKGHYSISDEDL